MSTPFLAKVPPTMINNQQEREFWQYVVNFLGGEDVQELLTELLQEQKLTNALLNIIAETNLTVDDI